MYKIYIKLKHRTVVVITNTVYTSILEAAYVHNKVSIDFEHTGGLHLKVTCRCNAIEDHV